MYSFKVRHSGHLLALTTAQGSFYSFELPLAARGDKSRLHRFAHRLFQGSSSLQEENSLTIPTLTFPSPLSDNFTKLVYHVIVSP